MFVLALLCDLILPILMVIAGYFLKKHPPKEPNGFIGYRSSMSRKNADTWEFANKYCGKLWMILGAIVGVVTVISHLPFMHAKGDTFSNLILVTEAVQIAIMIGSIFFVEKVLKSKFDDNGDRK